VRAKVRGPRIVEGVPYLDITAPDLTVDDRLLGGKQAPAAVSGGFLERQTGKVSPVRYRARICHAAIGLFDRHLAAPVLGLRLDAAASEMGGLERIEVLQGVGWGVLGCCGMKPGCNLADICKCAVPTRPPFTDSKKNKSLGLAQKPGSQRS
jgi:hypothetical protein